MLLYGKQIGELERSFLLSRFKSSLKYWDYRLYSDHLSKGDYFSLLKSIIKKEKIIFYSLESSTHSWKYKRPFNCSIRISHLGKKSLYFNLLANEYLSGYFKNIKAIDKRNDDTLFISSNFFKIKNFFEPKIIYQKKIQLFGLYGKKVPNITSNYHQNAQILYSKYKSALCLENSNEYGYLQGSYIPVLMAQTVPIINTNTKILSRVLNKKTYITLDEFRNFDLKKINSLINKKLEFIITNNVKNYFTNLFDEYLTFLKEIEVEEIEKAIYVSQNFKRKIFN